MSKQSSWIEIPELEGKKLPRTTTIIGLLDKYALRQWAAKMTAIYFKEYFIDLLKDGLISFDEVKAMDVSELVNDAKSYHKEVSQRAADIGTKVHNTIERFIKAEEEFDEEIDADIEKPFRAFLQWWDENDVVPIVSEKRIWSLDAGGYTGKLDLACEFNKKLYIIDFKSSNGFWEPDYSLQIASYRNAFEQIYNKQCEGMLILRLDKETGMPDPKEYDHYELWRHNFLLLTAFFHGLQAIKEAQRNG